MPEYRRPTLLAANAAEVSEWLRGQGMTSSTRTVPGDAMYITITGTSGQLDTAMTAFPNTGTWLSPNDRFALNLNADGTVKAPAIQSAVTTLAPPMVHTHAESDVTNLTGDIAGKAPTAHTHTEANVTNLVTDLATKAGVPVFAALANGATAMALGTNSTVKVTPTATATYTTTVPVAGSTRVVLILTAGASSFTITFGTGFKPTATLVTGTTAARVFAVTFISDGVNLYETGRTVAMPA